MNKPVGLSSFDVIRKIRRAAGTPKIGHAGTLDPLASGLLVICLGRYTKLATDFYANPLRRGGYYRTLANALHDAARNADPGSEHQLQFIRGLASYATETVHLDWIAGLVEGTDHLDGLARFRNLRPQVHLGADGREKVRDVLGEGHRPAFVA